MDAHSSRVSRMLASKTLDRKDARKRIDRFQPPCTVMVVKSACRPMRTADQIMSFVANSYSFLTRSQEAVFDSAGKGMKKLE